MTGRARRQQRKRARVQFFGVREYICKLGKIRCGWELVPAASRGRDFGFHGQPVPARIARVRRP